MKRVPPRLPTAAEIQERYNAPYALNVACRLTPYRGHGETGQRAPGMTPGQHWALLRLIYGKSSSLVPATPEELR